MSGVQYNIFISCFTMAGCLVSHVFAASVLAGVAGMALACVIILMKTGGPAHPLNAALRRGRALFSRLYS